MGEAVSHRDGAEDMTGDLKDKDHDGQPFDNTCLDHQVRKGSAKGEV